MSGRDRVGRPAGRARHRGVFAAEQLERRALLSVVAAGPEFRADGQVPVSLNSENNVAVAADADGDFVVVWQNDGHDGDTWGVFARLFDRAGAPRGDAFQVNSGAAGPQTSPQVAMDADGDFVVVWDGRPPGETARVYARAFAADGTPRGEDFPVYGFVSSTVGAAVAMDASGRFAVATGGSGGEGGLSLSNVYVRRFDAAAQPVGTEFRVNTFDRGFQGGPTLAMAHDGRSVVVWRGSDERGEHVYGRVYDTSGDAVTDEFRINTVEGFAQRAPDVAIIPAGDFVVTWEYWLPEEGGGREIHAQRFDAAGVPHGDEFAAAPFVPGTSLSDPSVAAGPTGAFVIAWAAQSNADGHGAAARAFDADGAPRGDAFRLDEPVVAGAPDRSDVRRGPVVAADAEGDLVAAWAGLDFADGSIGVFARLFAEPPRSARVVARHVFYNNSAFDGNDPQPNERDDAAIATDKHGHSALVDSLPTFANVTSYARGLNGVMVDVANLPSGVTLTADDFDFGGARPPREVTVRRGAGTNGSDRVTLAWSDYNPAAFTPHMATVNGWLRVTVKANDRTGLAAADVFSFGNLVAETSGLPADGVLRVNAVDLAVVKSELTTGAVPITSPADVNRDGRVNALDVAAVKQNLTRTLALATPAPAATPPSPPRRVADEVLA